MKNIFTTLLFMAIVIVYMPVGFAANAYSSIEEIILDGDEAIGKTTTLKLEYSSVNDQYYLFVDSGYNFILFKKDAKFKEIMKSMIKAKAEGNDKAISSFNYNDLHIEYFITFKIVGFLGNYIVGNIIKINDSTNKPMK